MAENQRTTTVQLGCGTLILIALIVLFFSRGGDDEVRNEIRQVGTEVKQLRASVNALNDKVEAQSEEIKSLRQAIEKKTARPQP